MSVRNTNRLAAAALLCSAVAACGPHSAVQVSSTVDPGHAIVSFPNRGDHVGTTVISSNPDAQQAGVNGRAFTITTFDLNEPADQLTLDMSGNLGIRGTYHSVSSRSAKRDVRTFDTSATALIARTQIVTFRYRDEPAESPLHVGMIAEDTPVPLADRAHRSVDLNSSIAVTIKGEQELLERIRTLEAEVRRLRKDDRREPTR